MNRLNINDLNRLSFPDFNVIAMQLDCKKKVLQIEVDGAWLEINHEGKNLGSGSICFKSWNKIEINCFNPTSDEWLAIPCEKYESLKDLCEVQSQENKVYLRGFGKKIGYWIEYEIMSPTVEVDFEESIEKSSLD